MFLRFLLYSNLNVVFENDNFMGLFEVIYVFCALFENINFADYLQFACPPTSLILV